MTPPPPPNPRSNNEPREYDRVELVWPGKTTEVERVSLPFQTIERVNEVTRSTDGQARLRDGTNLPDWWPEGWRNKLIWGDNKYVLSSLLDEFAGKVDLIYIDPPFATGADFSYNVKVGDEMLGKQPTALEELAYRDTWRQGDASYLSMMQDRLALLHKLLSPTGSILVHCDDRMNHYLRLILESIFGRDRFRNELIWRRAVSHSDSQRFGRITDNILFFSKGDVAYWDADAARTPKTPAEIDKMYPLSDHRGKYRLADLSGPGLSGGESGKPWHGYDISTKGRCWSPPRLGSYAEFIEEHFIPGYRDESGVHARLTLLDEAGLINHPNRGFWPQLKRYAAADIGTAAQNLILTPSGYTIFTPKSSDGTGYPTEKPPRLLRHLIRPLCPPSGLVLDAFCGSGATLAAAGQEGRLWIGIDIGKFAIQATRKRLLSDPGAGPFEVLNLGRYERRHWQGGVAGEAIWEYYRFILQLYGGAQVSGFTHLHGEKGGRMVSVGLTDAPVTRAQVDAAAAECAATGVLGLDVLGWEWEMGLNPKGRNEIAAAYEIDIHLLNIPREVMDQKAVDAGDIHFFELGIASVHAHIDGLEATLELDDFIPAVDEYMSKKVGDAITRWSDWIDYWAVDWDYDGEVFTNSWQAYRTRKEPSLMLRSDPHQYPAPGEYQVIVKVIDIFGNDTTTELTVTVGEQDA